MNGVKPTPGALMRMPFLTPRNSTPWTACTPAPALAMRASVAMLLYSQITATGKPTLGPPCIQAPFKHIQTRPKTTTRASLHMFPVLSALREWQSSIPMVKRQREWQLVTTSQVGLANLSPWPTMLTKTDQGTKACSGCSKGGRGCIWVRYNTLAK